MKPSIGKRCKRDTEAEKVMELGKDNGWRQCPGCRIMISRDSGCAKLPFGILLHSLTAIFESRDIFKGLEKLSGSWEMFRSSRSVFKENTDFDML